MRKQQGGRADSCETGLVAKENSVQECSQNPPATQNDYLSKNPFKSPKNSDPGVDLCVLEYVPAPFTHQQY